jgi:hypothetical protein
MVTRHTPRTQRRQAQTKLALRERAGRGYTEEETVIPWEITMITSATVPVSITPQAEARLAELGMHAEMERMIEHAREVLPEVARIEVVLNDRYDLGGEPGVVAEVYGKEPCPANDGTFWKLAERMVSSFTPQVLEHLHVSYHPGAVHAG